MTLACRLIAQEYSANADLDDQAAAQGCSRSAWRSGVSAAGYAVQQLLRNRKARLRVVDGQLAAEGVAGVLQLDASTTLEVCPKVFARTDLTWREDFLALALIATTGHLLVHMPTGIIATAENALSTLLARSFASEFRNNARRPIRHYRMAVHQDFALDGDLELLDLVDPPAEGFRQHRLTLSRDNAYTQVLAHAGARLGETVTESATRTQLDRVRQQLPRPGSSRTLSIPRLPSRHSGWQLLYDLAAQIVKGASGGRYGAAPLVAPGYVLDTWRAWQELCGLLCRLGLPGFSLREQPPLKLGTRDGNPLLVHPDVLATPTQTGPPLVVDAKYKGRAEVASEISSTDVYESLAFMEAAGATRTMLIQPTTDSHLARPHFRSIGVIRVGGRVIHGIEIQPRGLAQPTAMAELSQAIGSAVAATFAL